jgi:hypothetical protein
MLRRKAGQASAVTPGKLGGRQDSTVLNVLPDILTLRSDCTA